MAEMYNPYKRHNVCEPTMWKELVVGTALLILSGLCIFTAVGMMMRVVNG